MSGRVFVLFVVVCWKCIKGINYNNDMVNVSWINKTLLENFNKERNHFHTADKTRAFEYILEYFRNLSLDVTSDNFTIDDGPNYQFPGNNAIGILRGKNYGTSKDKIQIVGTYYDTEPETETSGSFTETKPILYNGGGIVVLLELSRLLVLTGDKEYTIIFVLFDYHFQYKDGGLMEDLLENTGQCCHGAKHFVSTWLTNFLSEYPRGVKVGEVVIIDSILVYVGKQTLNEFIFFLFKEVREQVVNDPTSNFLFLVTTKTQAVETFINIFNAMRSTNVRLITLRLPAIFADNTLVANAERLYAMDALPFYIAGYNGTMFTDTGKYRGDFRTNKDTPCCKFVLEQGLPVVADFLYSMFLTLELKASSKHTGIIQEKLKNLNQKTTPEMPISNRVYSECRTDYYDYDEELNLYFKINDKIGDAINWWTAKRNCEIDGASLLQLDTLKESQYFSMTYLSSNAYQSLWIGMSDYTDEGNWIWTDGTNVTDDIKPCELTFDELFDCVLLRKAVTSLNTLIPSDCQNSFGYICSCARESNPSKKEKENDCDKEDDGYIYIEDIKLWYKVYKDEPMDWVQANRTCEENMLFFPTYREYVHIPDIIKDVPKGEYFIGLVYENGLFTTRIGISATFPFPLDTSRLTGGTKLCGVLVYDSRSPRIEFVNCAKKLSFICGIYCEEKTGEKRYTIPLDIPRIIIAIGDRLQVVETSTDGNVHVLYEIVTKETIYNFDFLNDEHDIFWHSRRSTYIVHSKLIENNYKSTNILKTDDPITEIALDFEAIKLYWACRNLDIICVSEVDGSRRKILFSHGIITPQSLQVDPYQGKIFWINGDFVKWDGMDGERHLDKITELSLKVDWLRIISLFGTKNLVLAKGNILTISQSTMVEQAFDLFHVCFPFPKPVFEYHQLPHDLYLVIMNGSIILYYMDTNIQIYLEQTVIMPVVVYHLNLDVKRFAFKVIHRVKEEFTNPCLNENGNCENLCLLSAHQNYSCVCHLDDLYLEEQNGICNRTLCEDNNGGCSHDCRRSLTYPYVVCSCPEGFALLLDHKTCISDSEIVKTIFFATRSQLNQLLDDNNRYTLIKRTNEYDISMAGGIEYDPIDGMIYMVSRTDSGIHKMYKNGTGDVLVFVHQQQQIEMVCLALDWLNRDLFFVVNRLNTLEKVELVKRNHSVVVKFEKPSIPLSITIDIFSGYIYAFTRFERENVITSLQQMRMDGSHMKILVEDMKTDIYISASLNTLKQTLYFISGMYGRGREIHQVKTSGRHLKILIPENYGFDYKALTTIEQLLFILARDGSILHLQIRDNERKLFLISRITRDIEVNGKLRNVWYKELKGTTLNCTSVSKCLGYYGDWICLSQDQICNGVYDCYDLHDEIFCKVCMSDCNLSSLQLFCNKDVDALENANLDETKQFVRWNESVLSKLISFKQLLPACELKFTMKEVQDASDVELNIHTLTVLHRLRQALMQDSMANWQGTEELILIGPSILEHWNEDTFSKFYTLKRLVLSKISTAQLIKNSFHNLTVLQELRLNLPFLKYADSGSFFGMSELQILYITNTKLKFLHSSIFTPLAKLQILNLTSNMLTTLSGELLNPLAELKSIDCRGNPIILKELIFTNNERLFYIYSDTYSLCCVKPDSVTTENCFAPQFDVSSCEDLVENLGLSICLWIFGILALFGNSAVLIYRAFMKGELTKDSYTISVTCLSISDFLMGIYMVGIAFADANFRGEYVWREYEWRKSIICQILGMLSLISSEASVCFIAVITIDRYLLVKYPFREIKISRKQAFSLSLVIWTFCFALSFFPLYGFDDFYSSSGVCTALPLRSDLTTGWIFSFCVFVCFNFFTFVFIALAQWPIYLKVKETVNKVRSTAGNVEYEVAKKLTMVVITDCLCWLPIGIMGLLAVSGIFLSRRIYALVVIFVMPINAALNPIIYTFPDFVNLQPVIRPFTGFIYGLFERIKYIWKQDYCRKAKGIACCWVFLYTVVCVVVLLMYTSIRSTDIVNQFLKITSDKQEMIIRQHHVMKDISVIRKINTIPISAECNPLPSIKGVIFTPLSFTSLQYECTNGSVPTKPWQRNFIGTINCVDNQWETIDLMHCKGCYRDSDFDSWYVYVEGLCFQWALSEANYFTADVHCSLDGTGLLVSDTKHKLEKINSTLWSSTRYEKYRLEAVWADAKFKTIAGKTGWFYNNGTLMKYTELFGDIDKINGKEDDSCILVFPSNATWKVESCYQKHSVICEYSP